MARQIEVKIVGDASSLNRAFGSASGAADSFGRKLGHGAVVGLKLLGAAAVAASGAVATGIGYAINKAAEFEAALNEMGAVSGATDAQMQAVSETAKTLGADLTLPGVSASDAAVAMTQLAKGGLSAEEAMDAAKGTIQLAAAAGVEVGEAAEFAADNLNMFGLAGGDAGHVADVLANAAIKTTGDIEDFALALKMAGTVASKQFGLSIDETTALLMELADAGVKGSDAGTSLKTMLMRLGAPTEKASSLMKDLGVQTFDAQGKFVGMRDIIGQYQEALGPLSDAQRTQALATIFGADAIRAANIIFGEGVEGYDEMTRAAGEAGTAQEIAAAKMEGLTGAWEGFKSNVETAAISLGEKFLPHAERLVEWASSVVGAGSVGEALGIIADGIGSLGKAIIEKLGDIDWGNVGSAILEGLGKARQFLSDKIGTVDWAGVAQSVGSALGDAFKTTADWIGSIDWSNVVTTITSSIGTVLGSIDWGKSLKALASFGIEVVSGLVKAIANADFGEIMTAIGEAIAGALEGLGAGLVEAFGLEEFAEDLNQTMADILDDVAGFVSALGDAAGFLGKIPIPGGNIFAKWSGDFDAAADSLNGMSDALTGTTRAATPLTPAVNTAAGALNLLDSGAVIADEDMMVLSATLLGIGADANTASPKISGMTGELEAMRGAVEDIPPTSVTNVSVPGAEASKGKADDVTSAVRDIPNSWKTRIDTLGVSGALGSIGSVAAALAGLRDKTITVTVWTNNMIASFQHGGTVRTPLALVGEAGPELIAPPRGSRVFSNPESRRMMAGGGGGGGGGGITWTGDLVVNGTVMTDRDLLQFIRNGLIQGPGSINPSLWGARA